MAAEEIGHRGSRAGGGNVGETRPRQVLKLQQGQVMARMGPGAADRYPPRVGHGVGHQLVQSLVGAGLQHCQTNRGGLEHVHGQEIVSLVTGVVPDQGLDDDVRDVVARDGVAVGLGLARVDRVRPGHSPAGTGHVGDDHTGAEGLLQLRLLILRSDVRLSARIEGDDVRDRLGGVRPLLGLCAGEGQGAGQAEQCSGEAEQKQDSGHRLSGIHERALLCSGIASEPS